MYNFKLIFVCLIKFRLMVTKVIKLSIMKNEQSALGCNILIPQYLLISLKKKIKQPNQIKKKSRNKQTTRNPKLHFFSPTVMRGKY